MKGTTRRRVERTGNLAPKSHQLTASGRVGSRHRRPKCQRIRMTGLGKDVELLVHDAGHGFMNEENPMGSYDEALAGQVWPQMVSFLHSTLG